VFTILVTDELADTLMPMPASLVRLRHKNVGNKNINVPFKGIGNTKINIIKVYCQYHYWYTAYAPLL